LKKDWSENVKHTTKAYLFLKKIFKRFSYLSISWSLPSMGSDLGIREVDIKGGTDNGNGKDMGLFNGLGKWLAIEAVS